MGYCHLSLFWFITISSWPEQHLLTSHMMSSLSSWQRIFTLQWIKKWNIVLDLSSQVLKVGSDAFVDNSRSLFWSSGWIALKERNKMFNSYFQISFKTLLNIGRAAVLESDTKVERCENFEGKFLTENFWYCSLPPEILLDFILNCHLVRRRKTSEIDEAPGLSIRSCLDLAFGYQYIYV